MGVFALVGALGASREARAQDTSRVQGALWVPPLTTDSSSLPHINTSAMPGRWNFDAGLAVEFVERPYVLRDASGARALVDYQFWGHALANLGLASNVSVGLAVPFVFYQAGNLSPLGQSALSNVAFGDLRANVRVSSRRMYTPQPNDPNAPRPDPFANEGPGIAFVGNVTAPTADPRALSGMGAFTVEAQAAGDFRLFGMLLAANLGYRARFNGNYPGQIVDCNASPMSIAFASCLGPVGLHDQLTWSAGVRMPQGLLFGVLSAYFEAFGAVSMRAPGAPNTQPVEMQLGIQKTFRHEWNLSIGGGTGVTDVPGVARVRALAMIQWAPRFIDDDGDGLRDNTGEDRCVGLPEDRDGFEDRDGCPEDNDHDAIPDEEDRCPTQDEDEDGFQDEDGCPDPDNDGDGVLDAADRCRDQAMGQFPDEARQGCPSDDNDRDGVSNADDQCREEPRGASEDPARRGCPVPDRDHDGVGDPTDACPDAPAGANARADQRGCPDEDPDHDGVTGERDRCPTEPESIDGVNDSDGCPDTAATPANATTNPPANPQANRAPAPRPRPRVRVLNASGTGPDAVELLEAVRFTNADAVDASSTALLDQLALALTATARNPSRAWALHVRFNWPAATATTATTATTAATTARATPRPPPGAITAARATARATAVINALRQRSVPEWVVVAGDPLAPEAPSTARPAPRPAPDRGIVLRPRTR
jgi:OOP family OmpA-OmpF porin